MRKNLNVLCLVFLGTLAVSGTWAQSPENEDSNLISNEQEEDTDFNEKISVNSSKSINGIMKSSFIRGIINQKRETSQQDIVQAENTEKEIEMNSVSFLKFGKAIGEIFLPNPEVADVEMLSDKSLYLNGLTPGTTSLVIHDRDGKVLADYTIRVTYPLNDLKRSISKIFPDLDVEVISINDNLILKGNVASPEMAQDVLDIVGRFVKSEKIVNKLLIETATQVMLKVKIAEVSRGISKSLGVNWRALSSNSDHGGLIGIASGNTGLFSVTSSASTDGNSSGGGTSSDGNSSGDGTSSDSSSSNGANSSTSFKLPLELLTIDGGGRWIVSGGMQNLAALIDASASESLATVLAEPNLVALSGQSATFKSGGEYGYTVNQGDSSSNKTTEFKNWGTSLEFTPIVLSEDRINIKVKTEVSAIGEVHKDGTPEVDSRSVETSVELGSGQSIVLAGLIQKQKNQTSVQVPLLSNIPVIGSFFRSSIPMLEERELIIIVTPYIVKPSSKKLKTPVDMVPKMLSPLKVITKGRFTSIRNKKMNSAGFSIK